MVENLFRFSNFELWLSDFELWVSGLKLILKPKIQKLESLKIEMLLSAVQQKHPFTRGPVASRTQAAGFLFCLESKMQKYILPSVSTYWNKKNQCYDLKSTFFYFF